MKNFAKQNTVKISSKYEWFFNKYLRKFISFRNKIVLDVGGGIGLMSILCIKNGAKKVILLEPFS